MEPNPYEAPQECCEQPKTGEKPMTKTGYVPVIESLVIVALIAWLIYSVAF